MVVDRPIVEDHVEPLRLRVGDPQLLVEADQLGNPYFTPLPGDDPPVVLVQGGHHTGRGGGTMPADGAGLLPVAGRVGGGDGRMPVIRQLVEIESDLALGTGTNLGQNGRDGGDFGEVVGVRTVDVIATALI